MKVVKEGNWKNPWSGEIACSNSRCGTTLLVEESDIKPTFDEYDRFHFVCAVCGTTVNVFARDLPPRMVEAIGATRGYYDR